MLRELIIEHMLIGEMLRECWVRGVTDVEVLRSESDSFGYDLVIARGDVVRHVQLKSSRLGGKTREIKVGIALASKPSACVLWAVVTDDLKLDHFLWFGSSPGLPISELTDLKVAKHTKGDSSGKKNERPAHRVLTMSRFERLDSLGEVLERLLGSLRPGMAEWAAPAPV
jgi:hypothetical protein